MEIKAKVKITGGKWGVNGIPLEHYTAGEKGVMQSLVVNLIQIGKHVNDDAFRKETQPKSWESLEDITPTVSRLDLKKMNYKFPDWVLNKEGRPIYHEFDDVYPDITKIRFVKVVDTINGAFQKSKNTFNGKINEINQLKLK